MTSKPVVDESPRSRKCPTCGLGVSVAQKSCPVDGTPTVEDLTHGTLLDGKYEFLELVGAGGMGVIYKARQVMLNKIVAIKMLHSDLVTEKAVKRFHREVKVMSALSHPSIIAIHDFAMSSKQQPYMVMDYVNGQNLEDKVFKEGALDPELTVKIMLRVCEALEYAHNQGILHLDLKPSNILLVGGSTSNPIIKVLDFGIAKVVGGISKATLAITRQGENAGSPLYMSPEQCYGIALDRRSDLFSLGATMFECLTGYPPFVGNNVAAVVQKITSEPAPSLKEGSLGKEFSPLLESIVARLLSKKVENRYQSVTELSLDLENFLRGESAVPDVDVAQIGKGRSTNKTALFASAVSVLALLGAAIYGVRSLTAATPPIVSSPLANVVATANKQTADPSDSVSGKDGAKDRVVKWILQHPNNGDLNLASIGATDSDLEPLAYQTRYTSLDLRDNGIEGPGLKYLTKCNPTTLHLESNAITDGALQYLAHMTKLTDLNLSGTKINGVGLRYLKGLSLARLNLASTKLDDAGVDAISHMKSLRNLDLSLTKIDNDGIRALSALNELMVLRLDGDKLTDECIPALSGLDKLAELNVSDTGLTCEGLSKLAPAKGLIRLYCIGCAGDVKKLEKEFDRAGSRCVVISKGSGRSNGNEDSNEQGTAWRARS